MMFQSAPRSRDRGDAKYRVLYGYYCCFNPRPGHATGATNACQHLAVLILFQSAPRSRDRGDMRSFPHLETILLFQSAPRSRDRGDHRSAGYHNHVASFNPRPGHATGATFN